MEPFAGLLRAAVVLASLAAVGLSGCSFDVGGVPGFSDEVDAGDVDPDATVGEDGGETDGEVGPVCGNDTVEGTEECDGADLAGESCGSLGYGGGNLGCRNDCTFNVQACMNCGNGVIDPGEDCDGTNLDDTTCGDLPGLDSGVLTCGPDCFFDVTHCVGCGNGIQEAQEECDATDFNEETCITQGFDGGDLACNAGCQFDVSACTDCGDGVREGAEECDGGDLGQMGCGDLSGFDSGTLTCTSTCVFDTSGCDTCGDGDCGDSETGGVCIQDCSNVVFSEDFEGTWPGDWSAYDSDDGDGNVYWGKDDSRKHGGSHSLYCADEGRAPLEYGYANDMDAYATIPVDLAWVSGNIVVSFWVWCHVDGSSDWMKFLHSSDAGSTWKDSDEYGGNSSWEYFEVDVSNEAGNPDFVMGFYFHSNGSWSVNEGAYIDDIQVLEWW